MSELVDQRSTYIPPRVAVVVGELLRAPRRIGQSADFLDLFSDETEDQREYIDGLFVVSIILLFLFLTWGFILIVLKCKGAEVGCASGNAFVSPRSDDGTDEEDDNEKIQDDIASTSDSSNADSISVSSNQPIFSKYGGTLAENSSSDIEDNKKYAIRSRFKCLSRKNKRTNGKASSTRINPHERRTRMAFLLFASVALVCAPFTLFITFGPLQQAMMELESGPNTDSLFAKLQTIVEDVELSKSNIESTSVAALELVNSVPTDLGVLCPLVNNSEFEFFLGVDINGLIETIIDHQYRLREDIETKFSGEHSLVNGIENGLSTVDMYMKGAEKFIWILPGLLLAIGGLTTMAIVGVVLAWKKKSSARFQRFMSFVVLPFLVLTATICWLMLIALSLSTMIGTDICLTSSLSGSPDETILEILSTVGNGTDGTTYQMVSPYIDQCRGASPTQDVEDLKLETQEYIDNIWRQISKIDSVGRTTVIEKCGDTEEFQEMLAGARNLAMSLTSIRRELSNIEKSIGCTTIHPIYIQAAHDIACTESLSASAYGFVTLLVMWIAVMTMISLRASWLRNIEEEKVYHDETEVAENMVVDEHEEYLAYISRYKHEWQEYEGFSEEGAVQSSPRPEIQDQNRADYPYQNHANRVGGDYGEYYHGDHEDYLSEDESMDSESMYIDGGEKDYPADRILNHDNNGSSNITGEEPLANLHRERSEGARWANRPVAAASNVPPPVETQSYQTYDELSVSVDWAFSEDGISHTETHLRDRRRDISSSASSDSQREDNHSHTNFEPDFEKNFTHNLQPTGEVEVQLHHF